jgi:inhibitor of KinA sporulation pathway (predicted exonuclease)
MVPKANLTLKS